MVLVARMFVTIVPTIEMLSLSVTMRTLVVEMRGLRGPGITMGIDVHMQAAQLQSEQA